MNLADAVLRLVPLERQLPVPLGIPADAPATLDALFAAAGMRPPRRIAPDATPDALAQVALRVLAGAGPLPEAGRSPADALAAARVRALDGAGTRRIVRAPDGVPLPAFHAGRSNAAHPVLLIGAPGMPAELTAGWLRGFGASRPVAGWETRGMFGSLDRRVDGLAIDDQVGDAAAVLDDAGWDDAHVVGICGGAMLALAFAARHPRRARTLTLWFGDLDLGAAAPKTDHQRNLQALMEMVTSNQVSAQALRGVLVGFMAGLSDSDLAPLVLYPFANDVLLERYCRMNHPIMSTDCRPYLARITAPCLVGYGEHDTTTHPEGSRTLAALLGAELVPIPGASHLDGMRGHPGDLARVLSFQRGHDPR
uniref:alpha/beta fold hydrolase n=1 Tax=Burkholderia arboris TaxID=488730 RepID=UPI003BEEEC52